NAQRQLLESYMTRYREASAREDRNYLPVDARIFSRAVTPTEPYFPKVGPILSAAFVGTLLVMSIITLLQELFSGRAMRPAAVRPVEPVQEIPMQSPMSSERPDRSEERRVGKECDYCASADQEKKIQQQKLEHQQR